jgi:hypothetical protein
VHSRAYIAGVDTKKFQPYGAKQKPTVVLQAPRAYLSSQYLCAADSRKQEHIVLEVIVTDSRGHLRSIRALVDCGATSIFVSPRLVERLGLSTRKANKTTLGINGQVLMHSDAAHATELTVQYMSHRAPIVESDVLVVPIQAYDMVLGTPWFRDQRPLIDWARGEVLGLLGSRGAIPAGVDTEIDADSSGDAGVSGHQQNGQVEIICATAFAELVNSSDVEFCGLIEVSDRVSLGVTQQSGKRYLLGFIVEAFRSAESSAVCWPPRGEEQWGLILCLGLILQRKRI